MSSHGLLERRNLVILGLSAGFAALFLVYGVLRFGHMRLYEHAAPFCTLPASGRVAAMKLVVNARFITVDDGQAKVTDSRTGFAIPFEALHQLGRECEAAEVRHHKSDATFEASLTRLCSTYFILTRDRRGLRVEAIMSEDFLRGDGGRLFDEIVGQRSGRTNSSS